METNLCAVCKTPMRLVSAGISKVGKPYPAFYSCPKRCVQPKLQDFRQEKINQAIKAKQENINKAIDRREESIDAWASINNATSLVVEMLKNPAVFQNEGEIIKKIETLAEGIRDVAKKMKREEIFLSESKLTPENYERTSEQVETVEDINQELEM